MVTGLGIDDPVGRHAGQTMPPAGTEKCRCGPCLAAAGAAGQRRLPAGHRHRPQQERVEHQARRVRPVGERAQRADDQQEEPQRRLLLLRRQPVGGLEHRGAGGVAGVVVDDVVAVGADRLRLVDDVEVAACVELQVDVAERLQPRRRTCSWCGARPWRPRAPCRAAG